MGYVVAFQKLGQDSAATERIGFKSNENEDWRGERMVSLLEMEVECREEGSWQIHCYGRLDASAIMPGLRKLKESFCAQYSLSLALNHCRIG